MPRRPIRRRAAAAAGGRAQRAGHPARRRRLRRLERVRRAVQHADGGTPGRRRPALHALPHHGAVLADARRAAERAQPPHGRHGRASPRRRPPRPATTRLRPNTCAPLPEILQAQRLQHRAVRQVPRGAGLGVRARSARSTTGPPGSGFECFYGFIGGETNQWHPALIDGRRRRSSRRATPEEGYHLMPDLADKAIAVDPPAEGADARQAVLRVLRAGRDPRAAPRAQGLDRDKYEGQFDQGWDALREETFARQKELGVIPPDCELTARPEEHPRLGRRARRA